MLENEIWNFFTRTGSIETFLEYIKTRDLKDIDNTDNNSRDDN